MPWFSRFTLTGSGQQLAVSAHGSNMQYENWGAEMRRDETLLVLGIVVVMGGIVYIYVGFTEYIM